VSKSLELLSLASFYFISLQACKVQSKIWSKIGRLRRSQMPRLNGGGSVFGSGASPGHMASIAGRLLADTYLSSRELLKEVPKFLLHFRSSLKFCFQLQPIG
jgi:DNA polymerase alpha subunit A